MKKNKQLTVVAVLSEVLCQTTAGKLCVWHLLGLQPNLQSYIIYCVFFVLKKKLTFIVGRVTSIH